MDFKKQILNELLNFDSLSLFENLTKLFLKEETLKSIN